MLESVINKYNLQNATVPIPSMEQDRKNKTIVPPPCVVYHGAPDTTADLHALLGSLSTLVCMLLFSCFKQRFR